MVRLASSSPPLLPFEAGGAGAVIAQQQYIRWIRLEQVLC